MIEIRQGKTGDGPKPLKKPVIIEPSPHDFDLSD